MCGGMTFQTEGACHRGSTPGGEGPRLAQRGVLPCAVVQEGGSGDLAQNEVRNTMLIVKAYV